MKKPKCFFLCNKRKKKSQCFVSSCDLFQHNRLGVPEEIVQVGMCIGFVSGSVKVTAESEAIEGQRFRMGKSRLDQRSAAVGRTFFTGGRVALVISASPIIK